MWTMKFPFNNNYFQIVHNKQMKKKMEAMFSF